MILLRILPTLICILLFCTHIQSAPVLVGADQIQELPYFNLLLGKRIAILANQASVDHTGKNIIDILTSNPKIKIVELFSPEHGLRDEKDTLISDYKDSLTGLPVYSLYGKHKAPDAQSLKNIDIILIDLQDMGLRYYTYSTTLALVLKVAKEYHKEVILLDRVNPLSDLVIKGPILEKKLSGKFAAYYPIPTQYGLTFGELALYYNKFFNIHANLEVIPLKNWQRQLFIGDGLIWHAPSPALTSFKQAFLYSVFGALEGLNIAVGRGMDNDNAFKFYGAPWITDDQANSLVMRLQQLQLPGLTFSKIVWTPDRSQFKNELCRGFKIDVVNYNQVKSLLSLIKVLEIMNETLGDALKFEGITAMLGSTWMVAAIKNNDSPQTIIKRCNDSVRSFIENRKKILLYR